MRRGHWRPFAAEASRLISIPTHALLCDLSDDYRVPSLYVIDFQISVDFFKILFAVKFEMILLA